MTTVWNVLRWMLAALACLWLAFCTAVGPIYRADGSIADFSLGNAAILVAAFAVYLGLVIGLASIARSGWRIPGIPRVMRGNGDDGGKPRGFLARYEDTIIRATDRTWKLAVILLIGWLWCYATLLSAFGADLFSQIREFTSFWEQTHGNPQTYLDGTGVVNTIMDVYPTAHYLWPADPTFLTNQHNILLTLLYGGVAFASRALTGAPDAGVVLLSGAQFAFAAFCCAATANRFLNMPFLHDAGTGRPADAGPKGSAATRLIVLAMLLLNPIIVTSTIALTKSPLFAFAFVWWFGVLYEIHATRFFDSGLSASAQDDRENGSPASQNGSSNGTPAVQNEKSVAQNSKPATRVGGTITHIPVPPRTAVALAVSTFVMLASAKYAVYVVALLFVLAMLADRRRWRTWAVALLIPLIAFQGMLTALTASNTIINGDAIESKGIQLQQIGRVAQRNPQGIPQSAREKLAPIIDLDGAAQAYFPQDADRMKSSGSAEDKTIVYQWKTVTADDMRQFNAAWVEIVKANPVIAIDALLAESYGYFDVTDIPYVSAIYYIDNGVIKTNATHIAGWMGGWRDAVAWAFNGWSHIPVLGWPIHGNFWTVLVLVVGAAEVVLRRWRALAFHLPMLLLMGVMITAPANNFDRHMLPLVFVFAFLALWFRRDTDAMPKISTGQ
ncbi:hypothetical protein KIH77_09205 [Bifidobacterium sp. 82T24]|uniref:DUF6020 family protein n=1 Tax=Bifidobacterium pluvialisilvae TaxID=2834436 RepID=UPI001C582339|nr:DUF6020 family protein [Bifidobacterium pluvialisilvae]MBW3088897.1 hypothetical protein [Bifidobacterium pluvialisilvae]